MFEHYDEILTIDEICEILMIGRNAAYTLLNSGELHAFRIGKTWKIPKLSLETYILHRTGFPSESYR